MSAKARPSPGPASITKQGHTVWAIVLSLGAACALVLPGLGRSGLWHPVETQVATAARALASGDANWSHALTLPTLAWLPSMGLRVLPAGEWAARLPGALVAILNLVAIFMAARIWFGRRAAWLAVAALAGFPAFALEARQLNSDLSISLGTLLSIGALGLFRQARKPAVGIALFTAGCVIAGLFGGVLVAVMPLLLAAAAASIAAAEKATKGSARLHVFLMIAGAASLGLAMVLWPAHAGDVSWLLGGRPPLPTARPPTFDVLIETVGFGLFPLGVLGFLALYGLAGVDQREREGALLLIFTAAFGMAASTLQLHLLGQARIAIVPVVALALGAWIDERLRAPAANPLLGFVACVGSLLLMRDALLFPEALLSAHLPTRITWPAAVGVATLVRCMGVGTALGIALFIGWPAGSFGRFGWLRGRRLSAAILLATPVAGSTLLAHQVVPDLGPHLSQRNLSVRFEALAPPGTPLGLFGVDPAELGPFRTPPLRTLNVAADVVAHLSAAPAFALIARSELAGLDAALDENRTRYLVVDDSSSRALLLASGLPAVADRNPLSSVRWRPGGPMAPPAAVDAPAMATFGPSIKLLAVDFPARAQRGKTFGLRLTFRITGPAPHDHQIFVHLDRGGTLVHHGDHLPAKGRFPTQHWRQGDLITDETTIDLPRMSTPKGRYQVLVGFWPGGDTPVRLPLTIPAGSRLTDDGRNRAGIGSLDID